MTIRNTGGTAFPIPSGPIHPNTGQPLNYSEPGMTMRDWFAGQVIAQLVSMQAEIDARHAERAYDPDDPSDIAEMESDRQFRERWRARAAEVAYSVSDAMLVEREK